MVRQFHSLYNGSDKSNENSPIRLSLNEKSQERNLRKTIQVRRLLNMQHGRLVPSGNDIEDVTIGER